MAESAYHQEARRRQRVLERKHEALRKLTEKGLEDSENPVDADGKRKTPILFTGSGNFETHRETNNMDSNIVKGCISSKKISGAREKKNDSQRKQKPAAILKINRDQVYKILHPYDFESVYPWFGTQRDKRQYDHSRNGPLLPPTWHALRRELYNIGQGTPLLSSGQSYPTSFQDLQQVRVVTARK